MLSYLVTSSSSSSSRGSCHQVSGPGEQSTQLLLVGFRHFLSLFFFLSLSLSFCNISSLLYSTSLRV